jgi:hypothetical protein
MVGLISLTSLVIGAGLLAFAWNEFRGRALLQKLDLDGPRILAWNQIGLAGGVFVYCAWSAYGVWANQGEELALLEVALGVSAEDVVRLTILAYAMVFVVTGLVLAVTARYHFVRGRRLEQYLTETPGWIVDVQRSMARPG